MTAIARTPYAANLDRTWGDSFRLCIEIGHDCSGIIESLLLINRDAVVQSVSIADDGKMVIIELKDDKG